MNNTSVTTQELNQFVAQLSETYNARLKAAYPTCEINWGTVEVEVGKKRARLVAASPGGHSRSALGFIDLNTGDILKAASWSAPAKHARGNIRVGDVSNLWNGAFTGHSNLCVAYLR